MFSDGFAQGGTALYVRANGVDHLLHAYVLVAARNDLERANDWHARLHHGRDLAAEDGDIKRSYRLTAAPEQRLGLRLHQLGRDALPTQFSPEEVGVLR